MNALLQLVAKYLTILIAIEHVWIGLMEIFRWEKEEKLRPAAKLWVLAVLAPFVFMALYQAYWK